MTRGLNDKIKLALKIVITFCVVVFIVSFIVIEALIINTGNKKPTKDDYDYVVVLGAKINGDRVSLALKYRLDAARKYFENHKNTKIIVTGGRGDDEDYCESFIMKNYLVEHGVPEQMIIEESTSTTTYENLKNSYEIVGSSSILVATNSFHSFRAMFLAKDVGFDAEPLNAKTPIVIKIKMYIREYFAIVAYFLSGLK